MAQENSLVSIIINCRNGEQYLQECISSVLEQSYKQIEIIFFDNNSNDSTKKIIDSFDSPKIRYFRSNEDLSLGKARNKALCEAMGDYVSFLDADDIYLKDKVLKQLNLMKETNYEASYSGYYEINSLGKVINKIMPKISSGDIFEKVLKKYNVNLQTIMFKRKLVESLNLSFDENFNFSEDGDFFLNICIQKNILVIKEPLIKYRIHSEQDTKKKYHLVSKEFEITLNKLKRKFPKKAERYNKAFEFGFRKLIYYDFINELINGEVNKAVNVIGKIKFYNFKYFLIWFFLLITNNKFLTLKFINRGNEK
jgi:glycosyltransferase involved in cell wall biosynthesis|tara:strand:- start:619 stop:1548 length:930 start_codon:yes stop_codon:yes gene_type:complete